jgi:hypothetical protein
VIFYEFPHEPLALLSQRFYREKLSAICIKEKFFKQCCTYSLDRNRHENSGYNPLLPQTFSVEIPSWMGFWATTCCCLGPFWWESLRGWDFRPQLVVVSDLFGGNPFVDGILGHNLLLSQAFSHNFIYQEIFLTNFFLFSRWNSVYHEALLTDFFLFLDGILAIAKPFLRTFSFFSMEFWLSRSPSHKLFSFS